MYSKLCPLSQSCEYNYDNTLYFGAHKRPVIAVQGKRDFYSELLVKNAGFETTSSET